MIRGTGHLFLATALGLCGTAALAQEETTDNRVDANTDWSVFVENDPLRCWAVTAPKEWSASRDGRPVAVSRGDIYLLVFYQPGQEIAGQVQFASGYPFAEGSTVTVEIGDSEFAMFTDGEFAWTASPADDAALVTAMKRGTDAVVTGESGRGNTTEDTFSLLGFTASVEDAAARCAADDGGADAPAE